MKEEFLVKKKKISGALHVLWKSTGKLGIGMVVGMKLYFMRQGRIIACNYFFWNLGFKGIINNALK